MPNPLKIELKFVPLHKKRNSVGIRTSFIADKITRKSGAFDGGKYGAQNLRFLVC